MTQKEFNEKMNIMKFRNEVENDIKKFGFKSKFIKYIACFFDMRDK
ncbi:hypothetical protein [Mycoplasma enhydrae]|nr:hypothetical protein [Mycoplasma enhydrae]MBN4089700.1 hypothetical protein [Mycoplasma enhydrae]